MHDSTGEGMTPRFADYFNVGSQAILKVSYEIKGRKLASSLSS